MDTQKIIELAEKLSELPVQEVRCGDIHIIFDTSPAEPSVPDEEDFEDELEPAEEISDELLKFWSAP